MGGGRAGRDLSVSFDLLSLVSVGAGSSGLGPLGQCTTTRSEAAPALEELDGLMVTMPLQILPGLRHTCQDPLREALGSTVRSTPRGPRGFPAGRRARPGTPVLDVICNPKPLRGLGGVAVMVGRE